MFSRASFTAGASSRSRSSTARASRTAAAPNGSSSLMQISPRMHRSFLLFSPQLPPGTMTHDPTGGGIAEVAADDHHLGVREALHERLACQCALCLVHVEVAVAQRLDQLNRVMHEVAGDHRLLTPRADEHTDVSRRMPRSREERHLVRQLVLRAD